MTDQTVFYSDKINEYSGKLKTVKQQSVYVSATRFAAFVLLACSIYLYFSKHPPGGAIFIIAAALFFIILIRVSASLTERKNLLAKLLFINENEADIINSKDNAFNDGSGILKLSMHATDLDIFGKRSLYHLINRTTTPHGSASLSQLLNHPITAQEDIIRQQEALVTFAPQTDLRQLITAHGLLQNNKDNNIEDILEWIETPDQLAGKKLVNVLRFLLPVIVIAGFLLYLSDNNPIVLGIGVLVNWLILGTSAKYTLQQHKLIGKKEAVLQQYATILRLFSTIGEDSSGLLSTLKNTAGKARQEIAGLSTLSALFDQRLNLLVSIFLNSFLLYDIHVMISLEKWKRKNRAHFMAWINAVGDIEKLNSLATFHFNNPDYIIPHVSAGIPFINAINIAHPLIPHAAQIANNINAGEHEKLLLVTGSNMSGKSTFLRTVGVNLLLAQCGLPVCAKEFTFTPMQILSSIRISDSLQENTSYFMAELKRLRAIIDLLLSGQPALVLIDEVLRGTNSEDKTYGSEELIKKLSSCNCLALFASHDLSLSTLEESLPGKVKNYCFESSIENGELLFDYKLHRGVATNKNASFLMKKMGIIE
jgi:hypothetical protein